ncbi:RanBP1 domain-containing protein [Mycena olivaceomarginata]|nr:RanBP1 domain-containing protein [Mycena olivaceomarginata]
MAEFAKEVIKPIQQIEMKTHEEDERVVFKMRAKLFRFDGDAAEWKERGTGDVRLLAHKETLKVRLVMRRDKTLKVCANHVISSYMRLRPIIGSDRSWAWIVLADYSESTPTLETLAISFANSHNAAQFKTVFEAGQKKNATLAAAAPGDAAAVPAQPSASDAKTADIKTIVSAKQDITAARAEDAAEFR